MKTTKIKAALCSRIQRRFAVNAKLATKKLKRGFQDVYVWLLVGLINAYTGSFLISYATSIDKLTELIYYSVTTKIGLVLLLIILPFHSIFMNKQRIKIVSKDCLKALRMTTLFMFLIVFIEKMTTI